MVHPPATVQLSSLRNSAAGRRNPGGLLRGVRAYTDCCTPLRRNSAGPRRGREAPLPPNDWGVLGTARLGGQGGGGLAEEWGAARLCASVVPASVSPGGTARQRLATGGCAQAWRTLELGRPLSASSTAGYPVASNPCSSADPEYGSLASRRRSSSAWRCCRAA